MGGGDFLKAINPATFIQDTLGGIVGGLIPQQKMPTTPDKATSITGKVIQGATGKTMGDTAPTDTTKQRKRANRKGTAAAQIPITGTGSAGMGVGLGGI